MKRVVLTYYFCTVLLCLFMSAAFAQQRTISGRVTAQEDNTPVTGVNVVLKGTNNGAVTDADGKYQLNVPTSGGTLTFSFIGFATREMPVGSTPTLNVSLTADVNQLAELIVTGSRATGRTALETAVPVDVISIKEIMGDLPQIDLAQILTFVAPSFNAVRNQGGDLDSHVDPIQLRNLAPNQTLVLVNGKRRHTSALLITTTAVGSPSTSVDMMTIPAAAIDRVEILRDGAAAQYGSDAVAGVINIILKKGTNKLSANLTGGGYINSGGQASDLTKAGTPDGFNYQFDANYGFKIGEKGYFNLTGQITQRKPTIRRFVNDYPIYDKTYLNNLRTDKLGRPVITNPELINAQVAGNAAQAQTLTTQAGLLAARDYTPADFSVFAGAARHHAGIGLLQRRIRNQSHHHPI